MTITYAKMVALHREWMLGNHAKQVPYEPQFPTACAHPNIPRPAYDHDKASRMSVEEIHKNYPRGSAVCPDCGTYVIVYASSSHYTMGDW